MLLSAVETYLLQWERQQVGRQRPFHPFWAGMATAGWKSDVAPVSLCSVTYARKILLHSPVTDESRLDPFVEQCLRDDVSIIAVFGLGSQRIEDIIDEIVVGDGFDPDRFVCTTSHADEPLDDVLNMLKCWEVERGDPVQEVHL